MKVLFAVNNEDISESIVKKYQRNFKEIISYKNVYYFNAILKEIQKDKSYDRIIVSEDLEQFTNTSYEQMDKFLFERLDAISDETSSSNGDGIPIVLICSERRNKGEDFLVRLFGIGIYNAIVGNDRSVDEVCRLINKPRQKKEAKRYYQIEADDVSYKAENENNVSEVELQNILAHFKRLGKNEAKYLESYNNVASQYNDNQLRIISKFLPLGVRAVLEEKSPKYQQVMAFNKSVSDDIRKTKDDNKNGLSQKLLINPKRTKVLDKPIVIPGIMNSANNAKKLTRKITNTNKDLNSTIKEPEKIQEPEIEATPKNIDSFEEEQIVLPFIQDEYEVKEEITEQVDTVKEPVAESIEKPVEPKRKRGRPRKNKPIDEEIEKPKRKRGRPRKNPLPEEEIAPEVEIPTEREEIIEENEEQDEEYTLTPNISNIYEDTEDIYSKDVKEEYEDNSKEEVYQETLNDNTEDYYQENYQNTRANNIENDITNNYSYSGDSHVDISDLLQGNKKIISFVGTSKNGTSFIVNNLAELLSSTGINVAILDTTKNRNAYYIYTKNEEDLRRTAMSSIRNLSRGIASGVKVNSNLSVYTSLPNEDNGIENVQIVLETLIKSHTIVLIDCDFWSPKGYFSAAQEVYLVQTMDVLTIQPLTAFLKDLITQNILDEHKLRVIVNKYVKIRGISEREIIGGMAYYNDPAMTYQTGLFDKSTIKYISIPFEEETYTKYLQGLINCEISLKGYSKGLLQSLKQLGSMVYPNTGDKANYSPPALGNVGGTNFSSSMNNTLDQMKRNY